LRAYALCKELIDIPEVGDANKQLAAFAKFRPSSAVIRDTADTAVLLVSELTACGIGYEHTLSSGKKDYRVSIEKLKG
jgi:hypothetical protein